MNTLLFTRLGYGRKENQDSIQLHKAVTTKSSVPLSGYTLPDPPFIVSVLDGIGGEYGGKTASSLTANYMASLQVPPSIASGAHQIEADSQFIKSHLLLAKAQLSNAGKKHPELAGMGTTLAGILVREKTAIAFNCGDSRVYRFAKGELERLTEDHSIAQNLVNAGTLPPEDVHAYRLKNVITSSVSAPRSAPMDIHLRPVVRMSGDIYFLCTDGVWGLLTDEEIRECMENKSALKGLPETLAKRGQRDDASFIMLTI